MLEARHDVVCDFNSSLGPKAPKAKRHGWDWAGPDLMYFPFSAFMYYTSEIIII